MDSLNGGLCKVITDTTKKHIGGIKLQKEKKLTPAPLSLLSQRREMKSNTTSDLGKLKALNKIIKKAIRSDLRAYNDQTIAETIQANTGPKVFGKKLNKSRMEINKLSDSAGNVLTDRDNIIKVVEAFYGDLYASKASEPDSPVAADPPAEPVECLTEETIPPITEDEIEFAL